MTRRLVSKSGIGALLVLALAIAAMAFVATNHHGIRAALATVAEFHEPEQIAALYAPPDELSAATGMTWAWDDPAALGELKHEMRREAFAEFDQPSEVHALELLRFTRGWGTENRPEGSRIEAGWVENPVELCALSGEGKVFECHAQSIMLIGRASALGWRARMVNLDREDRLGRRGHTVTELWLPEKGRWVMLDPLYGLAWRAEGYGLLSVAEIRATLHPDTPRYDLSDGAAEPVEGAEVIFVASAPRHEANLRRGEEYPSMTTNVNFVTANAFLAGHLHRHGPLTGTALGEWIETRWPGPARAISRMLTTAGTRIHPHADEVSRPYAAPLWGGIFWAGTASAVLAALVIFVLLMLGWREGARQVVDTNNHRDDSPEPASGMTTT